MAMKWQSVVDGFNLLTHPETARTDILKEMMYKERPFDAEVLRDYAQKGFKATRHDTYFIIEMALKHGVTDVANALLDKNPGLMKEENPITTVVGGEARGPLLMYRRRPTYGEHLLKTAVETGEVDMIRRLHKEGVPADLQTWERDIDRMYIFRDLWTAEASKHNDTVIPVMKELYPKEFEQHLVIARTQPVDSRIIDAQLAGKASPYVVP